MESVIFKKWILKISINNKRFYKFQIKKYLFSLFMMFLLITIPNSCEKEPICACGVEDPQENLVWLKAILDGLICEDLYKFIFEGKEYLIISTCESASDKIESVYDCDGNILCIHGGKFPGSGCNLPTTFWENYENEKILIYKIRREF